MTTTIDAPGTGQELLWLRELTNERQRGAATAGRAQKKQRHKIGHCKPLQDRHKELAEALFALGHRRLTELSN
jgi:hypothetical protein